MAGLKRNGWQISPKYTVLEKPLDIRSIDAIDAIIVRIINVTSLAELFIIPVVFTLSEKYPALPKSVPLMEVSFFILSVNLKSTYWK